MLPNTKTPTRPVKRCRSTGASSRRYGVCEVCGVPAADVWIGTPDNGVNHVFGHEECVRGYIITND